MKTFLDFEKELNSSKLRNIYYIISSDNYFINKASLMLREKLFGDRSNNENFFLKYADDTTISEIIELNNNFPSLFSSSKLIVLKRCEKYSRKIEELFDFTEKSDPDTYMLLCFDKEFVKDKKIDKAAEFYDFSELPDKNTKEWIKNEFSSYGRKINDEGVDYLESNASFSFDQMHNEIDKICSYDPDSNEEITKNLILKLTGFEEEYTPNDLMKSIIRNDPVKAVQVLDNLLNKSGINEIYLVSIISNYYFDLLSFQSGKFQGADNYSLYGKYKLWGERLNFAKEYRNVLKIKDIEKAISLLCDTDLKLKTSMIDSKILLTSLVEELCNM
jgi:DNA polymerase III delta subunit